MSGFIRIVCRRCRQHYATLHGFVDRTEIVGVCESCQIESDIDPENRRAIMAGEPFAPSSVSEINNTPEVPTFRVPETAQPNQQHHDEAITPADGLVSRKNADKTDGPAVSAGGPSTSQTKEK